jgi:CrcB protein
VESAETATPSPLGVANDSYGMAGAVGVHQANDHFGPAFPYGTLAVNLLGSFLLAGLMYAGVEKAVVSPTVRLALTVGVMGGFTTYSTFSYETMKQLQDGAWAMAITNVLVTVVGCLLACVLGWAGAKWLFGA